MMVNPAGKWRAVMTADAVVAVQIVRLLRQQPPGIWELVDAVGAARAGDVVLLDGNGRPVAVARPASS
jgi:hypothetical protein